MNAVEHVDAPAEMAEAIETDALARTRAAYHSLHVRRVTVVVLLGLLCLAALALDVTTGPSHLALRDVWAGLVAPETLTRPQLTILRDVRLPVAAMALVVGASLSLAGAEMQTILDNPMASPFTLGVSSAASFGAALGFVLGVRLPFVSMEWMVPVNALGCALGAVALLEALSRRRGAGPQSVVLFGIALVFAFNSLVALLQFVASPEALSQLVFWTMGSLGRATWTTAGVVAFVLAVALPSAARDADAMTALRLGEDRARSFGVDVLRLRRVSLVRISVLAAVSVAFVGTVGFVGLVGPHIARKLAGDDHRFLLPASALTGALLVSAASVASKAVVPGALLPVGIVTSLLGLPVFVGLLLRRPEGAS